MVYMGISIGQTRQHFRTVTTIKLMTWPSDSCFGFNLWVGSIFRLFFKIEYLVDLRLNATFTILNCVNIFFCQRNKKVSSAKKAYMINAQNKLIGVTEKWPLSEFPHYAFTKEKNNGQLNSFFNLFMSSKLENYFVSSLFVWLNLDNLNK